MDALANVSILNNLCRKTLCKNENVRFLCVDTENRARIMQRMKRENKKQTNSLNQEIKRRKWIQYSIHKLFTINYKKSEGNTRMNYNNNYPFES